MLMVLAMAALLLLLPGSAAAGNGSAPAVTRASLLTGAGAVRPLDARTTRRAIRYNNRRYRGPHRGELLAWLRGTSDGPSEFTDGDIATIAALQRGAGMSKAAIDGRLGKATVAVMLTAGLELSAVSASARRIELWFYPGSFEDLDGWRHAKQNATGSDSGQRYRSVVRQAPAGSGTLYVLVDGKVVDLVDARGGPPFTVAHGSHSADPSKPGRYRLGAGKPYRTDNWVYSQIPWGAKLRLTDGEVQYRPEGSSRWRWATGPRSELTYEIPRGDFYDDAGELMTSWRQNDFGAMAWRLRRSPGLLIHTSPKLEEAAAAGIDPLLPTSHGCVHVKPADRDRLVEAGYLRRGVTMVIKRYRDHLLPRPLLRQVAAHRGS